MAEHDSKPSGDLIARDDVPKTPVDRIPFCQAEQKRYYVDTSELLALAEQKSAGVICKAPESVKSLFSIVQDRLDRRIPFMMARVGNGEGNAFGMTLPQIDPAMYWTFSAEFISQNHFPLYGDEAVAFSHRVVAALDSADVIGVRAFSFDENAYINEAIALRRAYVALGLIYAREYFHRRLERGAMRDKTITSSWIQMDLAARLDDLLALSNAVVVITGRGQLRDGFSARLGRRLVDFIEVPVQGHKPDCFEQSHFAERFPEVCELLSRDLQGCLVLVGAGLFGKIYCQVARQNGAVALDLGSLFDALCGLPTRPIFDIYDVGQIRWL